MTNSKGKVFVGMSGGVDSSLSAALLKQQGYDVTGVFIKVWQADFLPCTWREERRDAMRIAAQLEIPFHTLNLEAEYEHEVVDYMVSEYAKGRVPNPDVMCNKYVKFGAFFDFARTHGATHIATGHYARTAENNGVSKLLEGVDKEKDQSYFLWTLDQRVLPHVLFPIGDFTKPEVRKLAATFGLATAEKKDSQGLCFLGKVDMRDFLKHYLKTETGKVLDQHGTVIGEHEGAILYTIGQRHGFTSDKRLAGTEPLYVVEKNIDSNTITVSTRNIDMTNFAAKSITTNLLHESWQGAISDNGHYVARIRYRGDKHQVEVNRERTQANLTFTTPIEAVTEGQSVVLYDGETVIGGGSIDKVSHT